MFAGLPGDRATELAQSVKLREMNPLQPPPPTRQLNDERDSVKVHPFAAMLQINYVMLMWNVQQHILQPA
jgi:hypothetical protein